MTGEDTKLRKGDHPIADLATARAKLQRTPAHAVGQTPTVRLDVDGSVVTITIETPPARVLPFKQP